MIPAVYGAIAVAVADLREPAPSLVAELHRRALELVAARQEEALVAAFAPPPEPPPAPPRPSGEWWAALLTDPSAPPPATWTMQGWSCPFRRWLVAKLTAYYSQHTDPRRAEWLAVYELADEHERRDLVEQARAATSRWP